MKSNTQIIWGTNFFKTWLNMLFILKDFIQISPNCNGQKYKLPAFNLDYVISSIQSAENTKVYILSEVFDAATKQGLCIYLKLAFKSFKTDRLGIKSFSCSLFKGVSEVLSSA